MNMKARNVSGPEISLYNEINATSKVTLMYR